MLIMVIKQVLNQIFYHFLYFEKIYNIYSIITIVLKYSSDFIRQWVTIIDLVHYFATYIKL